MTAPAAILDGLGVVEWPVWTTTARLVVTDPAVLERARASTVAYLGTVDVAASRFRKDSEVSRLAATGGGRPTTVSPLLAELVAVALRAADRTDGAVDPTVGRALADLGYDGDLADRDLADRDLADRDLSEITVSPLGQGRFATSPAVSWRDVHLDGRVLTMPAGVLLELGATAKAHAADHCATLLHDRFGCGVLVSLGGDLRAAGPPPADGWEILVQDGPGQPASQIQLRGAEAVATSSTLHRTWRRGPERLHHIVDPLTLRPAPPVWRTVSVAAATCVAANTLTTAALVRGNRAVPLLTAAGVPARLVAADGRVAFLGGWPE